MLAADKERLLTEALDVHGLLGCSDGGERKVVNDCYALRSLPCDDDDDDAEARGRQPCHSDLPQAPPGATPIGELADADADATASDPLLALVESVRGIEWSVLDAQQLLALQRRPAVELALSRRRSPGFGSPPSIGEAWTCPVP